MKHYPMPKNDDLVFSMVEGKRARAKTDYATALGRGWEAEAKQSERDYEFASKMMDKVGNGKRLTQSEWDRLCAIGT